MKAANQKEILENYDLPDKESVSRILDSRYDYPNGQNGKKLNKGGKNQRSAREKLSQSSVINLSNSKQYSGYSSNNQKQWVDRLSQSSLQSANHFYDSKMNGRNKKGKSLQKTNGIPLRKKLINFSNGRYGADQVNLDHNSKDFDAFSTEYRKNYDNHINRNCSLPSLKAILPQIREDEKEMTYTRKQFLREQSPKASSQQKSLQQQQKKTEKILKKKEIHHRSQTEQNYSQDQKKFVTEPATALKQQTQQEEQDDLQQNGENQETEQQQQEDDVENQEDGEYEENYTENQDFVEESPTKQKARFTNNVAKAQLDAFMDDNEEYFKHLRGECLCLNDKCGQCKCPYRAQLLKPELDQHIKSQYTRQFGTKKAYPRNQQLDVRKYQYVNSKAQPMDIMSTTHADYKAQSVKVELAKERGRYKHEHPFIGRSTYGNEFIDFKAADAFIPVKQSQEQTVVKDMTFNGRSMYKQEFVKKDHNILKPTMNSYMTTTVKSPIPFMAETTNKQFYKPFKASQKAQQFAERRSLQQDDSYSGQFKSQYQNSYQQNVIDCPGYKERVSDSKKKPKVGFSKIKSIKDIKFEYSQTPTEY